MDSLKLIQDEQSVEIRGFLDTIIKGIRRKRPHLHKLVIDFSPSDACHGPGNQPRLIFLQIKFASEDRIFQRVEDMR